MAGHTNDTLSPEMMSSIEHILDLQSDEQDQEKDPLDVLTDPFRAVDVLNSFFPDEASLGQIDAVQARLAETERKLQEEIVSLQQELRRDQDPSRMQLIQEMISDLLGQMSRIREKATESEAVVRNITKDIQALDMAKKNLILSMTALRRLQMLVNALAQLDELVQEKKYAEIAQILGAVKQISASFQEYKSIPLVLKLWRRIQEVQGKLRSGLDADFDAFYLPDPAKLIKPAVIADACLVVDVLGPDVRAYYVDRYVTLELKDYRRVFRPADEAGQLDNIARRFAWFRRVLQSHETEQGRVFPPEWRVDRVLCAKFSDITREDMSVLLSKAGPALTVKLLLDSLQMTTEFELSMSRRWATPFPEILEDASPSPLQAVKTISSAFEPHLGVFVDAQDKAIADMLAPHRHSKGAPPRTSLDSPGAEDDEPAPALVHPSSTELFYMYGQSLEQCAKLSTGQALFDLCRVQKRWLKVYADEVLLASLKRPAGYPRQSLDNRFDLNQIKQSCLVINTADYCQRTALELEDKIRSKISDPFKEKVTLQAECEQFIAVVSSAITVLLCELESACDGAFGIMARTAWSTLNQVSGPSPYVADAVRGVEQVVDAVKPRVEQAKYLRNFFDKVSSLVLMKFTNSLVKSRPLKEIGAEQLLIDLQGIKGCLLKFPGEDFATSSYTRGVNKIAARLEALLKVIVTPVDPADGFILNYTLLVGDASFANFQKILDLKGTPKSEQNSLLDSFLTITSTKSELESTSFLSSLDMDPPSRVVSTSAIASPGSSRIALPFTSSAVGEGGIFGALGTPPLSGPPAGSGEAGKGADGAKREVFSDFRRFVTFGLRRDSAAPTS